MNYKPESKFTISRGWYKILIVAGVVALFVFVVVGTMG